MIPIRGLRAPVAPPRPVARVQPSPDARTRLKWTAADKRLLRHLWDTDVKLEEIAEIFGTTKNSIIGKADRMGLPRRQHLVGRSVR